MGGCTGFEHLEHTADVLVRARGRTLEEAFEYSILGVYEVMTNTSLVRPKTRVDIEAKGFDLENLLYRWVEEHLVYTDQDQLVFSIFRVCGISREGDEWIIRSSAWGEKNSVTSSSKNVSPVAPSLWA
jgi:SHS2 domain-containing protein